MTLEVAEDSAVVSVVVFCYNYGRFLGRAVDSARNQRWPHGEVEIIVVDDGSTDDTAKVLATYGDSIRVHRQTNQGLMAAFRAGVSMATGDYICLLSADDTMPSDRVARQVGFLKRHPEVALTYGDMTVIDVDDKELSPSFFAQTGRTPASGELLGPLLAGNQVSGGPMMWRRSLHDHIFPVPECVPWEDWWVAVRAAQVGAIVPTPGAPVYNYRFHGENMNLGSSGSKFIGLLQREIPFRRYLLSELDLSAASSRDLLTASLRLEDSARQVARHFELPLSELLPVEVDQQRRARALINEALGDIAGGRFHSAIESVVGALAVDPWCAMARLVRDQIARESELAATAEHPNVDSLDLRQLVAVASGRELVDDPRWLEAWGRRVASRHGATLVAHSDVEEPAVLRDALAALGLDGPDGPDVVLTAFDDDRFITALDTRSIAWLGDGLPPAGFNRAWPWPLDRLDDLTSLLVS